MENIVIKGARENNLKNVDLTLPKNKLIVMTGVSGSGKSSLAFDTIYAEGQRRYVESLSAYARQFLGGTEKPDDYLRLLYARIGVAMCPNHHIPIKGQSIEEMANKLLEYQEGTKMVIMSPVVHGEKGTHKDLLEKLRKEGYLRIRVNGEMHDLSEEFNFEKNIKDYIDVVVDRIIIKENIRGRLFESLENAVRLSGGKVVVDMVLVQIVKVLELN